MLIVLLEYTDKTVEMFHSSFEESEGGILDWPKEEGAGPEDWTIVGGDSGIGGGAGAGASILSALPL